MKQNTAQHTPGPWKALIGGGGSIVQVNNTKLPSIGVPSKAEWLASNPELTEESQANARLVAAAPELLKALIKAVNRQGFTNEELIKARAVIAKATQD